MAIQQMLWFRELVSNPLYSYLEVLYTSALAVPCELDRIVHLQWTDVEIEASRG